MKVPVYDLDGKQVENIDLPNVFDYAHKTELIHRTVVAIQSNTYQPKGTDQFAGERTSASSCLLYTSPSPRDGLLSRMPSSA